MATEKKRMQQLQGTAAEFQAVSVPPKEAEICYCTDTKETKIGDGTTSYGDLLHFATTKSIAISLSSTWEGSAAPYSKVISVAGLKETDNPQLDLVLSDDINTALLQQEEFAKIINGTTEANKMTLYAKEKPNMALNCLLRILR